MILSICNTQYDYKICDCEKSTSVFFCFFCLFVLVCTCPNLLSSFLLSNQMRFFVLFLAVEVVC